MNFPLEHGLNSKLEWQFHHKNEKRVEREDRDESKSVAKIVVYVYNAGFYCLQSPFTLKFDREIGKYCVEKRSNIFYVIFVLVQLASVGMNVYMLQNQWMSRVFTFDDFTRKYTAIMSWLWIMSLLNFSWTLLRGQTRIQTSVNAIHGTFQSLLKLGISIPTKKQITYPAVLLVLYFLVWTTLDVVVDFQAYARSVSWTEDYNARCAAIMENSRLIVGEIGRLTSHFIDILCLSHAYTIYLIFHHFVNHLTLDKGQEAEAEENSTVKFNMVFDTLDHLCKLSDAFESSIGSIITFSCFGLLPYYAIQVQNLFQSFEQSFYLGFRSVLLVGTFGMTLTFAAEANSKMNHVVSWLQLKSAERRKTESLREKLDMQEKIGIIINQIQRNQIGLRAKFYTITYGFLGSMIGLLLTYSVMITQFKSAAGSQKAPY